MSANFETQEKMLHTMFWTFFVLTVIFTCYEFAVESYGLGLFVPDPHVRCGTSGRSFKYNHSHPARGNGRFRC